MVGWIIVLTVAVALGTGGEIGWTYLSKEHKEARSLSITSIDFTKLRDGTYEGSYEGGMYKWRANKVQVEVGSGRVITIKLLESSETGGNNANSAMLYDRVIREQSLQVDAISGATLTSKAYLKAVELALVKAQN
jgi:uncharacterized protein with FMN-binding domain